MSLESSVAPTPLDRDLGAFCALDGCQRRARHARKHGRYCSDACRAVARKTQATKTRAMKILGRLQSGPCTGLELLAAGGGIRYGARVAELRKRGHNITAENLGEGVWQYTLVV
jgi:hypothetical protein